MLYAKENRAMKKLLYSCRNCGHEEVVVVELVGVVRVVAGV
jgi:hypothetical protein